MKRFLFLENDYQCPASSESIEMGMDILEDYFGFTSDDISRVEVLYQFSQLPKEDIYEIVSNKDNVLITSSVYTRGSDHTFMNLLSFAGRNEISGITYIDTTGCAVDFINRRLRDYADKNILSIICGINSNNILTRINNVDAKQARITIEPIKYYGEYVKLTPSQFNPSQHGK